MQVGRRNKKKLSKVNDCRSKDEVEGRELNETVHVTLR